LGNKLQNWIELAKKEQLSPEELKERLDNRGYVKTTVDRLLRRYKQHLNARRALISKSKKP
jgi:hypothetical protein